MDLFVTCTRHAYRFPSAKGEINVEDLWKLPLSARNGFDLDNIARDLNRTLKGMEEESFVTTGANPARTTLQNKLDIVKHIIAVKQREAAEATARRDRQEEISKIEGILLRKREQQMNELSEAELMQRLEELKK